MYHTKMKNWSGSITDDYFVVFCNFAIFCIVYTRTQVTKQNLSHYIFKFWGGYKSMGGDLQLQGAELSRAGQSGLFLRKSLYQRWRCPVPEILGKVKENWEGCLEKEAYAQALKDE